MITSKKYISACLAVIFSVSSIGCGQGFRSTSTSGDVTAAQATVNDELAKAQEATKIAEDAMAEAQAAIAEITDSNGEIKVQLFQSGSAQSKSLLSPIIDKLNGVFDQLFAKVDMVKARFAEARLKLADVVGKLDPNDPSQAALISEINSQLARIDALEARFRTMIHGLAGKLDIATAALDRVLSGATSLIPGWGLIVSLALDYFVMGEVKAFIAQLKTRLLSI